MTSYVTSHGGQIKERIGGTVLWPNDDDFGPDLPLLFKQHEIWLVAFLENCQNLLLPPDVRFYG